MVKKVKSFFFNKSVEFYKLNKFSDNRGNLKKIFKKSFLDVNLEEIYVSSSKNNVFRGLHYTTSKRAVNFYACIYGELIHYFFDTRLNSKTFGKLEYYKNNNQNILIKVKSGIAHGVLSKKENSLLLCLSNIKYDRNKEKVIHYSKAKIKLPKNVLISKKDR